MTIFFLIAGIAALILAHEWGHFFTAKRFKVRVEEFGFGFPPRLWSRKKGETRISVNLLPLGGFVRLYGESRDSTSLTARGGGSTSQNSVTPPLGVEPPHIDQNRAFHRQAAWKRALIIFAGVCVNFVLGWFIISVILLVGSPGTAVIASVAPESPAARAHLESGDRLTAFSTANEFVSYVAARRGEEIVLEIKRGAAENNEAISVKVVPRASPPPGEGALGVTVADTGIPRVAFPVNFWEGLKTSGAIVWFIAQSLYGVLAGLFTQGRLADGLVGPVGIVGVAGAAAGFGFMYLFQLLAMISLNLVVLNILPIPALDGGRLLFIAIEKMKGSPVKAKREQLSHAIGFALLLLLMVFITARDIARIL